jgi:N4-gp56 family major capsid protein
MPAGTDFQSGLIWSNSLPSWQRDYYSLLLLETLRTKSILVPYTQVKEDFSAANSGVVVMTEVYDTEPDWSALTESNVWLRGAGLDSRTVRLQLEIHGDILKFSDYNEIVQYVNKGDMKGLVRDKIGQNQVDYLDLLARQAFLSHPNPYRYTNGSLVANGHRHDILATDLFDPDMCEVVRVHLEENEIPGVANVQDAAGQAIVCTTTPRVLKDIRTAAGSKWLEVQEYASSVRKFNGEVGMWAGVRFVKTNRLAMRNYGAVVNEDTLAAATVVGQGAAATVDSVYSVGQSNATRWITVHDESGFSAGQYITISAAGAHLTGVAPSEVDGTQETRRIVSVSTGKLVLDKPLLKPHAEDDWVTTGRTVHASIFHGGPGVAFGIGERPGVIMPPKYDDLMMVNRYGWRGFLKMQVFRPEYFEVIETAGSTD